MQRCHDGAKAKGEDQRDTWPAPRGGSADGDGRRPRETLSPRGKWDDSETARPPCRIRGFLPLHSLIRCSTQVPARPDAGDPPHCPRGLRGGISACGLLNDVPHRVCSPSFSPHTRCGVVLVRLWVRFVRQNIEIATVGTVSWSESDSHGFPVAAVPLADYSIASLSPPSLYLFPRRATYYLREGGGRRARGLAPISPYPQGRSPLYGSHLDPTGRLRLCFSLVGPASGIHSVCRWRLADAFCLSGGVLSWSLDCVLCEAVFGEMVVECIGQEEFGLFV
eukprot:scaffold26586_cov126-Isochrysis_galbana.AAC.2